MGQVRNGIKERTHGWVLRATGLRRNEFLLFLGKTHEDPEGQDTGAAQRTFDSSVVTLTPGPQDHGANLTCRVTFPGAGVSTVKTIQLNVYAPQNLTIRVFRGNSTGIYLYLLVLFINLLGPRAQWVLVVIGQAAVITLLLLLVIIILTVKSCKGKAARATENMEYANIVPGRALR
uniref:Uncharacterized protein n=1 Tax=Molossus molossus TaxID=27622 RepID=A0A7J8CAX5_MOLMO|nr:hypothetical protein HJG59_016522 [Molossus molossus]